MQKVKFTISKDGGKITAEGEGFVGKSCVDISDRLIAKLGTPTSREFKGEYFEEELETGAVFSG